MWTNVFWKDTLERAIKTAAQVLILVLAGNAVDSAAGFDVINADWLTALSFTAGGFLLSILTSIVSAPVGSPGASLAVKAVKKADS